MRPERCGVSRYSSSGRYSGRISPSSQLTSASRRADSVAAARVSSQSRSLCSVFLTVSVSVSARFSSQSRSLCSVFLTVSVSPHSFLSVLSFPHSLGLSADFSSLSRCLCSVFLIVSVSPLTFPHSLGLSAHFSSQSRSLRSLFLTVSVSPLTFPHSLGLSAHFSSQSRSLCSVFLTVSFFRLTFPHCLGLSARFSSRCRAAGRVRGQKRREDEAVYGGSRGLPARRPRRGVGEQRGWCRVRPAVGMAIVEMAQRARSYSDFEAIRAVSGAAEGHTMETIAETLQTGSESEYDGAQFTAAPSGGSAERWAVSRRAA